MAGKLACRYSSVTHLFCSLWDFFPIAITSQGTFGVTWILKISCFLFTVVVNLFFAWCYRSHDFRDCPCTRELQTRASNFSGSRKCHSYNPWCSSDSTYQGIAGRICLQHIFWLILPLVFHPLTMAQPLTRRNVWFLLFSHPPLPKLSGVLDGSTIKMISKSSLFFPLPFAQFQPTTYLTSCTVPALSSNFSVSTLAQAFSQNKYPSFSSAARVKVSECRSNYDKVSPLPILCNERLALKRRLLQSCGPGPSVIPLASSPYILVLASSALQSCGFCFGIVQALFDGVGKFLSLSLSLECLSDLWSRSLWRSLPWWL